MTKALTARIIMKKDSYSIAESASLMNVSEATVRNWIKTEYLKLNSDNSICGSSLDNFRRDVIGVEKLNSRANKLYVDIHDHLSLTSRIEKMIIENRHYGDQIADFYEKNLSIAYKNQEGIYYTPSDVCREFFDNISGDLSCLTFLDPCCGTGNFILAAIDAGLSPKNIYGFDVDDVALSIARERVKEATGYETHNLFHADFLNLPDALKNGVPEIDVIFTNPPWGKKFRKNEKDRLAQKYSCPKSLDSSGIFILECRHFISKGGVYGMLLPDSFFNVAAFEFARQKLVEDKIICICDHGKIFDGLLTKAVSFVATREYAPSHHLIKSKNGNKLANCAQESFYFNPKTIINYKTTDRDSEVLDYLFSIPHLKLAGRAKWALGVVTGNNKLHIRKTPKEGFVPIYKGSDVGINTLKQPSNWVSSDMSKFQQVAPEKMYKSKNKIIYKFISSKIVCCHDTTGSFILNSANLFITDENFPLPPSVLAEYLSSKFVNWIFEKIFTTHKILRSDLEEIPIFADIIGASDSFDETELLELLSIRIEENGSYRIKT